MLHGPRQSGKSTLARQIASEANFGYVTLDDDEQLQSALSDPRVFLAEHGTPLVIDEVQRCGDALILAIKSVVDKSNARGQYLLTGSTNFLTVPTISESLAGRVDIVELLPLAVGEVRNGRCDFVQRAFSDQAKLLGRRGLAVERAEYFDMIVTGGFPEAQGMGELSRSRWLNNYLTTVIRREIETSADILKVDALVDVARFLAANTSEELNISRVAEQVGIDRRTVDSFVAWLQVIFVVRLLPAWGRNLAAQVAKRPKISFVDTALAARVLNKDASALARLNEPATGPLLETFVASEIAKHLTWAEMDVRLCHFRDNNGAEIDIVLEAADGSVVGIEVKSATLARSEDFRWLSNMRDRLDSMGSDFKAGIVLHTGTVRSRHGDRMLALPISDLWT